MSGRVTSDQWVMAKAMRLSGVSFEGIAKELGVSDAMVCRYAKKNGWPKPNPDVSYFDVIDLTGKQFGRLTAISYAGCSRWNVVCACGVTKSVRGNGLRRGLINSCGCLFDERCENLSLLLSNDITGKRFGKLVAVGRTQKPVGSSKRGGAYWLCKCDCGNDTTVRGSALSYGKTSSCGCAKLESRVVTDIVSIPGRGGYAVNVAGVRFGSLVAISPSVSVQGQGRKWECHCDCGNTATVRVKDLRSGNTTSCGCAKRRSSKRNLSGIAAVLRGGW